MYLGDPRTSNSSDRKVSHRFQTNIPVQAPRDRIRSGNFMQLYNLTVAWFFSSKCAYHVQFTVLKLVMNFQLSWKMQKQAPIREWLLLLADDSIKKYEQANHHRDEEVQTMIAILKKNCANRCQNNPPYHETDFHNSTPLSSCWQRFNLMITYSAVYS